MSGKEKRRFLLIFLTGYLTYSSIYIARLNFSVAAPLLEGNGILNKAQIGIIGSIFSLVYALSKLPNGYIGDKFSTKKVIICGLCIAGISNLMIGMFPGFLSIAVLWGINAYGQSMLWGPMLRTFSDNYGETRFKKISQLLVSSVAVGSILGLWLAARCASMESAAVCFFIPGGITLLMAFATALFFADAKGKKQERSETMGQALLRIFGESKFRWMTVPAIAHGMIKDNINVWLAIYFVDTYGIDLKKIAGFIFLVPVFAFLGRILYLPIYRAVKNEYIISMLSFGLCGISAVVLCIKSLPAALALLCLGMISALVSMINTHLLSTFPAEFSGQNHISFIASIMDMLTYGGAGIGSLCFGVLILHFGYESMFLIWTGASILSVLFLFHCYRLNKK